MTQVLHTTFRQKIRYRRTPLALGAMQHAQAKRDELGDSRHRGTPDGYAVVYRDWSSYSNDLLDQCFGNMYATLEEARAAARVCAAWKQCPVRIEHWNAGTGMSGGNERVVEVVGVGV